MPAPRRVLHNCDRQQATPDLRQSSLAKTPCTPTLPRLSPFPHRPVLLRLPRRRKEISPRESPFLLKAKNPASLAVNLCPLKLTMVLLVERSKVPAARLLEILWEQTRLR